MRMNAADVPEKTAHDPRSPIFITQRFDQDKPILNSTGGRMTTSSETTWAHPRFGR
jgi:hypothetical protein